MHKPNVSKVNHLNHSKFRVGSIVTNFRKIHILDSENTHRRNGCKIAIGRPKKPAKQTSQRKQ